MKDEGKARIARDMMEIAHDVGRSAAERMIALDTAYQMAALAIDFDNPRPTRDLEAMGIDAKSWIKWGSAEMLKTTGAIEIVKPETFVETKAMAMAMVLVPASASGGGVTREQAHQAA